MPILGEIKKGREIGKKQISQSYIYHACEMCGKPSWVELIKGKPRTKLCHSCAGRTGKGCKGLFKSSEGYVLIKVYPEDFFYPMVNGGNYVFEHRLIVAKRLGRCLAKNEVVHHLNGIKDDNRSENLVLVLRENHPHYTYIHSLQERIRFLEYKLRKK